MRIMFRRFACLIGSLLSAALCADDSRLHHAIYERLNLMDEVAAYKWVNNLPVEDLLRERAVLERATVQGLNYGIRLEDSRRFFLLQMDAAKQIQQFWFSYWADHSAPVEAPDLNKILRPALMTLGDEIIRDLALVDPSPSEQYLSTMRIAGLPADASKRLAESLATIRRYDNRLEQISDSGLLRVGTTGDYAPFSYRAELENDFTGIDVELAAELAKALGVQLRFVQTSWPSLLDDLSNGRFDIAMSGVSWTAERQKVGYFSVAYYTGGKTPISRCDATRRFDSLAKIDTPTTRVIVNPGGTNERFVDSQIKLAKILRHSDNRSIFEEIIHERADVMITDRVEVQLQTARHPVLCSTMPDRNLNVQQKAYLMPQDDELKDFVDAWLTLRLADGTLERLFDKHID